MMDKGAGLRATRGQFILLVKFSQLTNDTIAMRVATIHLPPTYTLDQKRDTIQKNTTISRILNTWLQLPSNGCICCHIIHRA